jgi:hypothetical protein
MEHDETEATLADFDLTTPRPAPQASLTMAITPARLGSEHGLVPVALVLRYSALKDGDVISAIWHQSSTSTVESDKFINPVDVPGTSVVVVGKPGRSESGYRHVRSSDLGLRDASLVPDRPVARRRPNWPADPDGGARVGGQIQPAATYPTQARPDGAPDDDEDHNRNRRTDNHHHNELFDDHDHHNDHDHHHHDTQLESARSGLLRQRGTLLPVRHQQMSTASHSRPGWDQKPALTWDS